MNQKNFLNQKSKVIESRRRNRWWMWTGMVMAAVAVAFVTAYLLILPAATMEHSILEVTATPSEALLRETIYTEIYAEAEDDRKETVFVLMADGANAGLDEEQLDFDDDDIALVQDEDEQEIELHREYGEDGVTTYWFTLEKGQSSRFVLPWINGVDRYCMEEAEEETPIRDHVSSGTKKPEASKPSGGKPSAEKPSEEKPTEEKPSEEKPKETVPAEDETKPEKETSAPKEDNSSGSLASDSNASYASAGYSTVRISLSRHEVLIAARPYGAATDSNADPAQEEETKPPKKDETKPSQEDETKPSGEDKDHPEKQPSAEGSQDKETDAGKETEAAKPSGGSSGNSHSGGHKTNSETSGSMEIVIDQEGDELQEGFLSITFGSGTTLSKAKSSADKSIELAWLSDMDGFPQIPEDATSWAIVEKEGFSSPRAGGIMMLFSVMEPEGQVSRSAGYDFTEDIVSATVSKLENGKWVPSTEFTNGDSAKVEIQYTIPANIIGSGNQTIYYQLPDGVQLPQAEEGTVYDGEKSVGSYIIDTDGRITVTFDDSFSDDKPFTGTIGFQGKISVEDDGSQQEINFGSHGGTITVKPTKSQTDIHTEKTGKYDAENKKIHYTITTSTQKGTEGTVTISDRFNHGCDTSATYDEGSFKIVKIKADGKREAVSGYSPVINKDPYNPHSFTINDLPKLEAGEQYEVTYTATPGKTNSASGASKVSNSATSTSGKDSHSNGSDVTISQEMVRKEGQYDDSTGKIKWTIVLNKDKRDIGGYVLKDTMTVIQNGSQQEVTIPRDVTITMTGTSGPGKKITLPYTFPAGSKDTYTITYETDAPHVKPGESWKVSNKAEVDGGDNHYENSGEASGTSQDYGLSKLQDNVDPSSTDELGIYKWVSQIVVPKTGLNLDKLTYTDTLTDVSVGGKLIEGSHYITAAQLDKMTVRVNGKDLVRGTDYLICDKDGNVITDFSDESHQTGFQVKFLEAAKKKLPGQTIELRYQTLVDYTKMEGGTTGTIRNTANIPDHEGKAEQSYTKPKPPQKLKKQASITAVQGNNSTGFTDNEIKIDYEQSGGIIHYRFVLITDENTKGQITVTDLLPKGATLVKDSLQMWFYINDNDQHSTNYNGYIPNEHIHAEVGETNPDGTTPVVFTIDGGYEGNTRYKDFAVYYDVSVKDDPIWENDPALENHTYHNEVTWESEHDGADVTVEREVPDLKKTGAQLPQYNPDGTPKRDKDGNLLLSNTVQYSVLINAGAKDLVPESDYITLKDKLSIGNAAGAEFRPGNVKLYRYSPDAEDHRGIEIDSSLYTYTYDDQNYELSFSLPDSTACVLVYEYIIDRGNAAGDLSISNEANLTGGSSSGSKNQITLKETTSSATATRRKLTLYKVDAASYGKLLPGAKFRLDVYQNYQWTTLPADLITDENGEITLTKIQDEHFDNFDFSENTLYRLVEIQAPEGYTILNDTFYFVWVKEGQTADNVKQNMKNQGLLGYPEPDNIRFLTASGEIYVPNEPSTLSVKKLWQDKNGASIEKPDVDQVEVTLFQQPVDKNGKTVTVNYIGNPGSNGWFGQQTQTVTVGAGSNVTIQISTWTASLKIQVGNGDPVTIPSSQGKWTYTVKNVDADTTIRITPTDPNKADAGESISFSDFKEPSFVPQGDAKEYAKVSLNSSNEWSYSWDDLPKEVDGKKVYYFVKETIPVPGFEVSYSNNNKGGIQAGELVVVNRASGSAIVLPEAGGPGAAPFTTGGLALILLSGLMYIILHRKGDEDNVRI